MNRSDFWKLANALHVAKRNLEEWMPQDNEWADEAIAENERNLAVVNSGIETLERLSLELDISEQNDIDKLVP